jgi:hypothetical protein
MTSPIDSLRPGSMSRLLRVLTWCVLAHPAAGLVQDRPPRWTREVSHCVIHVVPVVFADEATLVGLESSLDRNLIDRLEDLIGVPAAMPEGILTAIGCDDRQSQESSSCDPKRFDLRPVDLDGDGTPETLLDASSNPGFSGSGGFSTWLFRQRDGRAELIQMFFGGEVRVLGSSTNGYRDLSQVYRDYDDSRGYSFVEGRYVWTGRRYFEMSRTANPGR